MKNTRLSLIFLMCLIVNISAYSQDENLSSLDYASELERMVTIPKSPEAAAFAKYGNTDVSLYTGTPNISVPVFNYNGRELALPINLTYDASGLKVEDEATWVGAGWNLNIGGRISRITNGLPDDYFSFGINQTIFNASIRQKILKYVQSDRFFDTSLEVHDYFQFIADVNQNAIDIEPDYFSINVLGINDYFVMDLNTMQARSLRNPRIKIEYDFGLGHLLSFIVTNEDGTKFYFNAVEKTYSIGSDETSSIGLFQNYISSWLLTKIESANGKDTYEFIYKDIPKWEQPFPVTPVSHVSHEFVPNSSINYVPIGADNGPASTFTPSVQLEQKYLTKVRLNGKDIILINFEDRYDTNLQLRNTALKNIQFLNSRGVAKTTATFNYGYFGLAQGQNPAAVPYTDIRLKLNELSISGSTAETVQKFKFEYDQPENVFTKTSLAQDYLGYQNGKTGNNVLYPSVVSGGITFQGADRSPSLPDAKKGTLNKITYPTGGFTLFNYELNTISTSVTNTIDVQYGGAVINSSTPNMPSGDCGPCCIDKYQSPPKAKHTSFEIFEAGNYVFTFQSSGTAEAYVFENNNPTLLSYNQILGSTCELPLNFNWIKNLNSSQTLTIEEPIFLTPGKYQITLINGTFDNSGSSSLFVHRNEAQSNIVDMPKAGLRIKDIKDYSSQGQLALFKEYKYIESLLNSKSSGKIIYDPQLYYLCESRVEIR